MDWNIMLERTTNTCTGVTAHCARKAGTPSAITRGSSGRNREMICGASRIPSPHSASSPANPAAMQNQKAFLRRAYRFAP